VGTVGRLQTVKNQPLLARAFVRLLQQHPEAAGRVRLVVVGEGPLRAEIEATLAQAGVQQLAWLAGARDDVAAILPMLDCFVLPSQAEGTSCTLQEAMACGLPVVATAVGGTPALVQDGVTGQLVPFDDVDAMANAIWAYASDPPFAADHSRAAREHALTNFGVSSMAEQYMALLDRTD
jgi:glycosyltransferase involved in cell wall biosynthesis